MAASETVLQAVRGWLKDNADSSGSLTDAQVIVARPDATRPAKPYLMVNVTTPGIVVGADETILDLDGSSNPRRRANGIRRASVSVQGFGAGAEAWLERAMLRLAFSDVSEAFTTAGVDTPIATSGLRDIAALVGTAWEPRFALDLDVGYGIRTASDDAESPIELLTVDSDTTLTGTTPTDLTIDQTITL